MLYYATYRLKEGKWKPTLTFENKRKGRRTIKSCAEEKGYIIAKTEEELKRKKRWEDIFEAHRREHNKKLEASMRRQKEIIKALRQILNIKEIEKMFSALPEAKDGGEAYKRGRDKEILELRFGLGDKWYPRTLETVGHSRDLSGGTISQIEQKYLKKLLPPEEVKKVKYLLRKYFLEESKPPDPDRYLLKHKTFEREVLI